MKEKKVIYEPHPVSKERKAELVAQGYKIIDAKYKPKDKAVETDNVQVSEACEQAEKKVTRSRRRRSK